MVSSKKASLYDRITQERINQNWPRVEKLCKDQENKHVLKHTAAKNLALKEHRHLFFKLLQAEAHFEIFLKKFYNYDTDLNFLVKTLVDRQKDQIDDESTIAQILVANSNLSKKQNNEGNSQFPFPSAGKTLSKLTRPSKSKSRDRLDRQNSETGTNLDDTAITTRERHESARSNNKQDLRNLETNEDHKSDNGKREKSADRHGDNKSRNYKGHHEDNNNNNYNYDEKYDLDYFIHKFKDLRKDFKKLPRDKKIELVQKFNCYGFIEATIHLVRCYFFSGKLSECKKMLIDEILVDKFDPKSEKIKMMNSVLGSSGITPGSPYPAFHNSSVQEHSQGVLVNDDSYSSEIYQNGQLVLGGLKFRENNILYTSKK